MALLFIWLSFLSPFQQQQFQEVYLAAFEAQNRLSREVLLTYFHEKIVPRLQKDHLIHLAFDEEQMAGFAVFEKWEENIYYLAEMAVHPHYQNQGVGKKLVFSLFEKDPQAQKIVLMTETANVSTHKFYEHIGFQPSSFQHPDYPEGFIAYEYAQR